MMANPFFDLRKRFESETNLNYESHVNDIEMLEVQNKVYEGIGQGESGGIGLIVPDTLSEIAKQVLKEREIDPTEVDRAIVHLYLSADHLTTSKETVTTKKEPRGKDDVLYSNRSVVHGAGECVEVAALFAGMARSVGIPTRLRKHGEHVYAEAWSPDSGWTHVGYREHVLAHPEKPIFMELLHWLRQKHEPLEVARHLRSLQSGLKKFKIADPKLVKPFIKTEYDFHKGRIT